MNVPNYKKIILTASVVVTFIFSGSFVTMVSAQTTGTADNYSGLVKCSGVVRYNGEVLCNFSTFISSITSIINWLFFISVPIAVGIFAGAGLLYMTGKGSSKEHAKTIFLNVVKGFIIMLIAFTVVHTLVGWLVDPNFGAQTLLGN